MVALRLLLEPGMQRLGEIFDDQRRHEILPIIQSGSRTDAILICKAYRLKADIGVARNERSEDTQWIALVAFLIA